MTKDEVVNKIKAEVTAIFEQANERNEMMMVQLGKSQEEIDALRERNDALLQLTIMSMVHSVGLNLVEGPSTKQ